MLRSALLVFLFMMAAVPVPAEEGPPKMKMGDPWEMLYGGSGCEEVACATCTTDEERYANGAKFYRENGVGSMRVGICWCNVEKVRGTYDWAESDAKIIPIAKSGIHIELNITTTPEWSWADPEAAEILRARKHDNLAGCLPHAAEYWPDYERYLAEVVRRYRDYVKHYEIWNEPDGMAGFTYKRNAEGKVVDVFFGGDPVWYAELVKRSSQVIKAIDPEARIGVGSFEKKDPKNTAFLEGFYKQGVQQYYDAISMHPYGEEPAIHGRPFARDWIAKVREFMVANGDGEKPLWINEYSIQGDGVKRAFEIRRRLRLLRETPWISRSQPLVFTAILRNPWALKAHKQMSEEWKPRASFVADFEGAAQDLFNNWEWDIDCGPGVEAAIEEVYPRQGARSFKAATPLDHARVWILPYVDCDQPVFSGWYRLAPEVDDATFTLSIGIESGDILQEIGEVKSWKKSGPAPEWTRFEFDVDEHFPEWKDLCTVSAYLNVKCSDPLGFTIHVDDLAFGPKAQLGK